MWNESRFYRVRCLCVFVCLCHEWPHTQQLTTTSLRVSGGGGYFLCPIQTGKIVSLIGATWGWLDPSTANPDFWNQTSTDKGVRSSKKLLMTSLRPIPHRYMHTHTLFYSYFGLCCDSDIWRVDNYYCSSCCLQLTQWLWYDPLMSLPVSLCGYKCANHWTILILIIVQKDISWNLWPNTPLQMHF